MAMLADRKRKQKWVILDRNVNKSNNWSKDSNKFGQKLLERMGWKEGKGLGRNEDGLTDYVKVAYKNNIKGVGFKESVEWSVQQDNYKTLLGELSTSKDDTKNNQREIKSLEEKSQNSRARVHYRKFTRGKDLSRYSEKELANIFGKKDLGETPKETQIDPPDEGSGNKGLFTISGSSVDYFKNKMKSTPLMKTKSKEDLHESEDEHVSFGFGFKKEDNVSGIENGSSEVNTSKKNKKSKKQQKDTFVSYVSKETEIVISKKRKNEALEVPNEDTPSKKKLKFEASPGEISKSNKKSKKKIKNEEQSSNMGLVNPAFEPLSSNFPIKKHLLHTIIENETENIQNESEIITEPKEKKKKSKTKPDTEINIEEELKPKNRKKKNDSVSLALENPAFDAGELNEPSEEQIVKKKKKKCKGLDNPALNDSCFDLQETPDINSTNTTENFEVKRKSKKKSKGLDNPALDLNESENIQNEDLKSHEVKRKKKKSKGLDNPTSNITEASCTASQENKNLQNGIDNTALEISDCDIMLNVTDEPVKTTITPKNGKNTPRNRMKNVRFSKTNQEYGVPNGSPGDIDKRNELYDINTKVIQDGLRDLKKQKNSPSVVHNFDIKSVDKIDFCDDGFSKSPRKFIKKGIDNRGFDVRAQSVEESINSLTKSIDSYQAEVENGINENKMKKREDTMVGEFTQSDGENEIHEDGITLRFKYAKFNTKVPVWAKNRDATACSAKRSYKHLIRGDIIVGFKNCNLHKIDGYATSNK